MEHDDDCIFPTPHEDLLYAAAHSITSEQVDQQRLEFKETVDVGWVGIFLSHKRADSLYCVAFGAAPPPDGDGGERCFMATILQLRAA